MKLLMSISSRLSKPRYEKERTMDNHELSELDIRYVSGVQAFMSDDGENVIAVSWVDCPVLKKKHITMRTAASVQVAERFCRDLMKILGIKEAEWKKDV